MTYFSEKVVKEDLPEDALLLTRMDVQRILRISRSVFDSIRRAGGWEEATVRFGRAYRYKRDFVEAVARGEVELPSQDSRRSLLAPTWRQSIPKANAARREKARERREAKERAKAEEAAANFRKSPLTEVDPAQGKGGEE